MILGAVPEKRPVTVCWKCGNLNKLKEIYQNEELRPVKNSRDTEM